jgi:superfamily I DNA and RNA helicase
MDGVDADYPLCDERTLENAIDRYCWDDNGTYADLISILQAVSTIRKGGRKREANKPDSRGTKLRQIEDSIANLDNRQSRAVIETVEGVQRIRGLAGSGKTIVLALKAAYLHAQHPEWKIAVTFNTRSLKGQYRRLINTFYIEQTNEEPDWENLQIIQAWGAPGGGERNGIYYTFCARHDCEYLDFMTARGRFGQTDVFSFVCEKALQDMKTEQPVYDAVLVDEAQDFSSAFLRLCYELVKEPKRLIYAYDELQSLNRQSLPSPEQIFGRHPNGTPRVTFTSSGNGGPQQDIILEKCYRNSKHALVTAHALGFGIYRNPDPGIGTGLIQMFEQNALWGEVGYSVADGKLADGERVILERTLSSSPKFLYTHSDPEDLILFKVFDSVEEQNAWVVDQIRFNLENDELRPDDIIVINPDPVATQRAVSPIRAQLYELGVPSHTAGVNTSPDIFFDSKSVAFTGIYRAKGNEAAMVYVINAESCFESFGDTARVRNQLFTAITRSKAWVRVLGVGSQMQGLIDEFSKVKENQFKLNFVYPTSEQRKSLTIVNRDMSSEEKKKVKQGKTSANDLIDALESGKMYVEDLTPDQRERLRKLLGEGS